jgi:16S rRNA C967 or C1407 C5-methylase (RsmB/RsmF family)
LFAEREEQDAFIQAVMAGESREPAILVLQDREEIRAFPREFPEPWQPEFVVRLRSDFRAGKHPLYEKGAFYSFDFSSAFAASLMQAVASPARRVLDLCASPGGKAVFAWRLFRPVTLFCNEVIHKRTGALIANLDRCRIKGSAVWSADPSVYARRAAASFDLVLADVPCSGQSLLAKGESADGCFLPHMVDKCVGRQRRIAGMGAQCTAPGGHLLYMTCTYTAKENERVVEWLARTYPEMEAVEFPAMARFRSSLSDLPCYRLFPQQGLGAGAFACLLRRAGEPAELKQLNLTPTWRYGDPPKRVPSTGADANEGPPKRDDGSSTLPRAARSQASVPRPRSRGATRRTSA